MGITGKGTYKNKGLEMGLDLKGEVAYLILQDWGRGRRETGRDVGCGSEVGRK